MGQSMFDTMVAQAVFVTKVMERALHDPGPWTLSWGPFEVPVDRTLSDDGVEFSADFPAHCHMEPPYPVALLRCQGEVVAAKTIEFPGDGAFTVAWTLRAQVVESV